MRLATEDKRQDNSSPSLGARFQCILTRCLYGQMDRKRTHTWDARGSWFVVLGSGHQLDTFVALKIEGDHQGAGGCATHDCDGALDGAFFDADQ